MSITVDFNGRSTVAAQKTATASGSAKNPSIGSATPAATGSSGALGTAKEAQQNANAQHALRLETLRAAVANSTYEPEATSVAEKVLQESLAYLLETRK